MLPNNPVALEQPVLKLADAADILSDAATNLKDAVALPTRISCEKKDVGYAAFLQFGGASTQWIIKLDGREMKDVIMADSDRGHMCVYLRDHKGHFVIDSNKKQVVRKYLNGRVEIIPPILNPSDAS